jgi:hypothetical protein
MMETDPKDLSRGMAPSETMKKGSAIDPMGLLGDHMDNDQEMREVERRTSAAHRMPTPGPPVQSGGGTALSESALMPPPAVRTAPAAAQVPDPDLVKKMFQRMGENGSQQAATPAQMNSGQGTKIVEIKKIKLNPVLAK